MSGKLQTKLFAGLEEIVSLDEPLAEHTWLKIGGPATYFLAPRNVEELTEVVGRCREAEVPMYVLGGGANLLIDDSGVRGAVVHLGQGEFTETALVDGGLRAPPGPTWASWSSAASATG